MTGRRARKPVATRAPGIPEEPTESPLRALAELVRSCRAAQRAYFRIRDSEHLREAKRLEAQVDALVSEILAPPDFQETLPW